MTTNLKPLTLAISALCVATVAMAAGAKAGGEAYEAVPELVATATVAAAPTGTAADMGALMNKGIAADLGSTAFGLSMGAVETNPLGWALVPLKFMAKKQIEGIKNEEQRRAAAADFNGAQWGAAAANVCTLALGNPVAALLCFAGGAYMGHSKVMAVQTTGDCVRQHEPMFKEAAATGRVYQLDIKTCVGKYRDEVVAAAK